MIYVFKFTQKPFKSLLVGQVETEHFYKWFVENAPFGCRLEGKPEIHNEFQGGVENYTEGFNRSEIQKKINTESERKNDS